MGTLPLYSFLVPKMLGMIDLFKCENLLNMREKNQNNLQIQKSGQKYHIHNFGGKNYNF